MLGNIPARRAYIQRYDLGFLRRTFMQRYPSYATRFDVCATELKRLLVLALYAKTPLEVTSLAVDALWEEFIRTGGEYESFCMQAYDELLRRAQTLEGYEPGSKHAKALYRLYQKHFGKVPDIWREDAPTRAS